MKLTDWADTVRQALDLDPNLAKVDEKLILDVARDAAHGVARPAAPLTTYLLGIAVGQGADPREVAAKLSQLARDQTPADPA